MLCYYLMNQDRQFVSSYSSPLGDMLMSADGIGLTGLWFVGQKYFASFLAGDERTGNLSVFDETKRWLDVYFAGHQPDFVPKLHLIGTDFQLAVWRSLLAIPYGTTATYGRIATAVAAGRGLAKVSARAVGKAVGHNHSLLIVPCHRVMGANGNLTGYAAGIDRKAWLLQHEGVAA